MLATWRLVIVIGLAVPTLLPLAAQEPVPTDPLPATSPDDQRPAGVIELDRIDAGILATKIKMRMVNEKIRMLNLYGVEILKTKCRQLNRDLIGADPPPAKEMNEATIDYVQRCYAYVATTSAREFLGVGPLSDDQRAWVELRKMDHAQADQAEELEIALGMLRQMRRRVITTIFETTGVQVTKPEPEPPPIKPPATAPP